MPIEPSRDLDAPLVQCNYVARWVSFVVERGVAVEELLAGTGLTSDMLDNPSSRFTFRAFGRLLSNGVALTGDDSLGFEFGLKLSAASHGWLGIALITAPSLGEAIAVGERYMSVRSYPWLIRMSIEGDVAIMRFEEAFSLGPVQSIVLQIFFGAVVALGEFMMEATLPRTGHEFTAAFRPDPGLVARFRDRLPRIRADGDVRNIVRFSKSWLDKPLRWSDPVAHREAVVMLEQEQQLLAGGPLLERIRGVLVEATRAPSISEVAARLHLSVRSLSRSLREHGTSFHALRDEALRNRSLHLLQHTDESIDAIAGALGYADASGFHRAFRRWTGLSPRLYRERARIGNA